jgi:hypothetical protein
MAADAAHLRELFRDLLALVTAIAVAVGAIYARRTYQRARRADEPVIVADLESAPAGNFLLRVRVRNATPEECRLTRVQILRPRRARLTRQFDQRERHQALIPGVRVEPGRFEDWTCGVIVPPRRGPFSSLPVWVAIELRSEHRASTVRESRMVVYRQVRTAARTAKS